MSHAAAADLPSLTGIPRTGRSTCRRGVSSPPRPLGPAVARQSGYLYTPATEVHEIIRGPDPRGARGRPISGSRRGGRGPSSAARAEMPPLVLPASLGPAVRRDPGDGPDRGRGAACRSRGMKGPAGLWISSLRPEDPAPRRPRGGAGSPPEPPDHVSPPIVYNIHFQQFKGIKKEKFLLYDPGEYGVYFGHSGQSRCCATFFGEREQHVFGTELPDPTVWINRSGGRRWRITGSGSGWSASPASRFPLPSRTT